MSYDLDLFIPQPEIAPIDIIQQAALMSSSRAQTPLNQYIAKRLQIDNPNLRIKASVDLIQVMDDVEGIRITLYAQTAQVSIPFWFTEENIIEVAFRTAQHYIRMIIVHAGYHVYDPQLGRVVDIVSDLQAMMDAYKRAIQGMQSFLG